MKNLVLFVILVALLLALPGCTPKNEYSKYTDSFFDTFDTLVQVVAYTKSEQEFRTYYQIIKDEFTRLHRLYNIYESYEGLNNIKTINENAGVAPVPVDRDIIDLILFTKEWHDRTRGRTNIALGPVLQLWHDYRTAGLDDPPNAKLPPLEALQEAARHTSLDEVIVNTEKNTVFLPDPKMSLDVGAVAKGYATELAAQKAMAAGMESGLISAGGNVYAIGRPLDGVRERCTIGIHNPEKSIVAEDGLLDTILVNNAAIVTSGDYQRYYRVGGEIYHHLIDPETLMPATHFRAVTVVAYNSAVADFLSTELFLLPFTESLALAESIDGVEAFWVLPDGQIRVTEGMKQMLKSYGATNE